MKERNLSRHCQDCGSIISGRTDKKFCDDACRTSYNNRRRQEESAGVRRTDAILRRNRKILQFYAESRAEARLCREHLLASGFRPDFVTRIAADPAGGLIRYYYEFGLKRLSGQEVEVFRLG
jgi:hypothetical protein